MSLLLHLFPQPPTDISEKSIRLWCKRMLRLRSGVVDQVQNRAINLGTGCDVGRYGAFRVFRTLMHPQT